MSYIEFAKREFLRAGYDPLEKCEDDPNKWIQENVLELLEKFSKQGHSGSSAPFVVNLFKKLALFEPISPLMGKDDEWQDVIDVGSNGDKMYQNKIHSAVFKDGIDGKPYFIDAIIWVEKGDISFTGSNIKNSKNENLSSKQYIKLPFEPKSFYVDVIERNDEYYIKDEKQLKPVWEYYEIPEECVSYLRLKKLKKIDEIQNG